MNRTVLFDTSIGTDNLGDYIIMDYCLQILRDILPSDFFIRIPTHMKVDKVGKKQLENCDNIIVCGTNLLSSEMNKFKQWNISLHDCNKFQNLCLMGVGWWQYQNQVNRYTQKLLQRLLNNKFIHSVRDGYTEQKLKDIGITNVINTACPTMWGLTEDFCQSICPSKMEEVITTVTDYNRNETWDKFMLENLQKNYKKVYLWIQAYEDYNYVKSIANINNIEFVMPNISAYDKILEHDNIEYIGTRLHAGVRALNAGKRSLIIGIDNRALEISKDTNLPVVPREKIENMLEGMIWEERRVNIKIPFDKIEIWLNQFQGK